MEAEDPDVIHVATPGPIGLCGLAAAKLLGLPLVGSYHTELGPYALHLTRDAVVADAFSALRRLVLSSVRHRARTDPCGGRATRASRARFGAWASGAAVSTRRTSARDRRSEQLRSELLAGGDTLVLSVGRVSDEKRLDVLLDAFGRLGSDCAGVRLVIAGDGPARRAARRRAPLGVRLLGEVRGDELACLYASADMFCFPSTTDTFGQVLLEAGASGLPVIAARAGGAPELVGDRESGLLVAPESSLAFAEAIMLLAGSPPLRSRLGERARERATERSWSRALEELRDAYAAALAGPRADLATSVGRGGVLAP